jgi:hypothetical protein
MRRKPKPVVKPDPEATRTSLVKKDDWRSIVKDNGIPEDLTEQSQATQAKLSVIIDKNLDRMLTEAGQMPLEKLPVATAVLIDKLALLRGQPTSMSAQFHISGSIDDMRARLQAKPAQVVDVESDVAETDSD